MKKLLKQYKAYIKTTMFIQYFFLRKQFLFNIKKHKIYKL